MGILIGLVVTLGCVLGGFMAMGGHIDVLIQPWEVVIICGAALGTFLVANPMKMVKDTGKACLEAFKQAVPKEQNYLETLRRAALADARTDAPSRAARSRRISTIRTNRRSSRRSRRS